MIARHKTRFTTLLLLLLVMTLAACNLTAGGSQAAISGVPVVRIVGPLPNATYLEGVAVNIQAAISNAGADIDRIEVVVDQQTIATLPQPNPSGVATFSITQAWTAAGIGNHALNVIAFRKDGSSSAPAGISVSVIAAVAPATATTLPPTNPAAEPNQPTNPPSGDNGGQVAVSPVPPTSAPVTVAPAATATSSQPMATINQGINVRSGPSTLFNPPIGSFAAAQTAEIVAKTSAGDWLKVKYFNGEGWIYAAYATISGDAAAIPIDNGPPLPTLTPVPIVPTAVPPTAAPASNVNLLLGNARFDPPSPACNQTMNIYIDVANLGTSDAPAGGFISVDDFAVRDGSKTQSTQGAFPALKAGQTVNVGPIPITVSTYKLEQHKLILKVDSSGVVAEANENDNTKEMLYTLEAGSCP